MFRKMVLAFGLFYLCIIHATAQGASDKIKVIATIFPNYDFTKQIGKDKVDVVKLLPPRVEAHGFEPRPKDVVKIPFAGLSSFFRTSDFEAAVNLILFLFSISIKNSRGTKYKVVSVSEHLRA